MYFVNEYDCDGQVLWCMSCSGYSEFQNLWIKSKTVLRIHKILVRIWIRIRGSIPLTNGFGSGSGSGSGRPKNIWLQRIRIRKTVQNQLPWLLYTVWNRNKFDCLIISAGNYSWKNLIAMVNHFLITLLYNVHQMNLYTKNSQAAIMLLCIWRTYSIQQIR